MWGPTRVGVKFFGGWCPKEQVYEQVVLLYQQPAKTFTKTDLSIDVSCLRCFRSEKVKQTETEWNRDHLQTSTWSKEKKRPPANSKNLGHNPI